MGARKTSGLCVVKRERYQASTKQKPGRNTPEVRCRSLKAQTLIECALARAQAAFGFVSRSR